MSLFVNIGIISFFAIIIIIIFISSIIIYFKTEKLEKIQYILQLPNGKIIKSSFKPFDQEDIDNFFQIYENPNHTSYISFNDTKNNKIIISTETFLKSVLKFKMKS